jgi:hypothetical protein
MRGSMRHRGTAPRSCTTNPRHVADEPKERQNFPMSLPHLLAASLLAAASAGAAEPRSNFFGDPFIAVTHGLPGCPVPAGPLLTHAQAIAESHGRSQRGVSCYLDGRCRLSNSYLYDKEIIPRVAITLQADGRYADTSVWALGQRRVVWLMGCVANAAQARELVARVRRIDDVEGVIDELSLGASVAPGYETAASAAAH